MSDYSAVGMPPTDRSFSRKAAIVGVGETDYYDDYRAVRTRLPGYEPPTTQTLVKLAFERALTDSGLSRADIDGLAVSFTYGGPNVAAIADLLGFKPRVAVSNGNIMAGPLPRVCASIAAGKVETVAMVYAAVQRATGREYGGATYSMASTGSPPQSYYYHHPWGWSSQAAHWAMMFTHYQYQYGVGEADLGALAMQVRNHAAKKANAVMQKPMTIDDYMASRYIVRPLHLYDICLVNDGAVCLIVTQAGKARDLPKVPVEVAGWSHSSVSRDKMHVMVRERLRQQMQSAGVEAFAMAGLSPIDIGHFEGYDASTIHLVNQVEGYGFAEPGRGIRFCQEGGMALDGRLPTNTDGGNLSGSYMHGWSQIVEVVRQLRHEAGTRQVPNVSASLSALTQTDQTHPILYVRGDR